MYQLFKKNAVVNISPVIKQAPRWKTLYVHLRHAAGHVVSILKKMFNHSRRKQGSPVIFQDQKLSIRSWLSNLSRANLVKDSRSSLQLVGNQSWAWDTHAFLCVIFCFTYISILNVFFIQTKTTQNFKFMLFTTAFNCKIYSSDDL